MRFRARSGMERFLSPLHDEHGGRTGIRPWRGPFGKSLSLLYLNFPHRNIAI
jgi:hypothetical protein